nr:antitoxin [uncultured Desulfobacter sp.]
MKTITIRGIEPEVAVKLKEVASEQEKSLNQLILEFIKKNTGFEKEKRFSKQYDDLDDLFGRWSEDEYELIQQKIDGERQIDPDLWK